MTTHTGADVNGRPYAKVTEVAAGTMLIADGGFVADEVKHGHCIDKGELRLVMVDENGELYVACRHGKHMLDGQIENSGTSLETAFYMGFYMAGAKWPK